MDWNRFSGHSIALFHHGEITLSPKISRQDQADSFFLVYSSLHPSEQKIRIHEKMILILYAPLI